MVFSLEPRVVRCFTGMQSYYFSIPREAYSSAGFSPSDLRHHKDSDLWKEKRPLHARLILTQSNA